jgi:hypothetical protein
MKNRLALREAAAFDLVAPFHFSIPDREESGHGRLAGRCFLIKSFFVEINMVQHK